MRKRGATWDNLPLPAFSINDVIVERFKKWAAKKGRIDKSVLDEPKDVLMEKLHLINGSYLTNAAMLLFSKEPEKFPALTIPILPMCSIWQASSKAGGVELKKFAQFVKKTVCRSLFIQSTPAILWLNLLHRRIVLFVLSPARWQIEWQKRLLEDTQRMICGRMPRSHWLSCGAFCRSNIFPMPPY